MIKSELILHLRDLSYENKVKSMLDSEHIKLEKYEIESIVQELGFNLDYVCDSFLHICIILGFIDTKKIRIFENINDLTSNIKKEVTEKSSICIRSLENKIGFYEIHYYVMDDYEGRKEIIRSNRANKIIKNTT